MVPSSCCCNLKWNGYHSPPLPLAPPPPHPHPQPYPSPNHSIPSTRPTDRSSSRERSSQIPNDNALFQHVCFATNHGGLALIESAIILSEGACHERNKRIFVFLCLLKLLCLIPSMSSFCIIHDHRHHPILLMIVVHCPSSSIIAHNRTNPPSSLLSIIRHQCASWPIIDHHFP